MSNQSSKAEKPRKKTPWTESTEGDNRNPETFRRPAQKRGFHMSKERQNQPSRANTRAAQFLPGRNTENMQNKLIREKLTT